MQELGTLLSGSSAVIQKFSTVLPHYTQSVCVCVCVCVNAFLHFWGSCIYFTKIYYCNQKSKSVKGLVFSFVTNLMVKVMEG